MNNFEKFKQKATIKFGNQFDYSKFEYVNAKTKGNIVCKHHGDFFQTPDKHLSATFPCPICFTEHKSSSTKGKRSKVAISLHTKAKTTLLEYLAKHSIVSSNITFSDKIRESLITFNCHSCNNELTSSYSNLLSKKYVTLCKDCSMLIVKSNSTSSWDEVYLKLKEVNPQFEYIKPLVYLNRRTKVVAICPSHGEFLKTVQKHLIQSCPTCVQDTLRQTGKLPGGYCETTFKANPSLKMKESSLYYVKIGNLFKIGISINLENRLKSLRSKFKKDVILIVKWEYPLYESFLKEQEILSKFEEHRVFTKMSTELFKIDVLDLASI